jgi:beta-lactamase superfamily II metal-dependent hydrolase
MNAELKVLKALHGDAMRIRFYGSDKSYHNIFIDGGLRATYNHTIKKEVLNLIEDGEIIDLFVITHIDEDHISGVLKFIRDFQEKNLVNEYWFNFSQYKIYLPSNDTKISVSQGIELRDHLIKINKLPDESITNNKEQIDFFGAKISILSPEERTLNKFEQELSKKIPRMDSHLIAAKSNDYSKTVEELAQIDFQEDTSITNRSSISFLFEHNKTRLLLLADAFPSTIVNSLSKLGYSCQNKLQVDYTKISHHGSKFSTNNELVQMLDCSNYIISANGKNRHYFPNKQALARIINNSSKGFGKEIKLFFNYDKDTIPTIFSDDEIDQYNIKCIYAERKSNGISIKF